MPSTSDDLTYSNSNRPSARKKKVREQKKLEEGTSVRTCSRVAKHGAVGREGRILEALREQLSHFGEGVRRKKQAVELVGGVAARGAVMRKAGRGDKAEEGRRRPFNTVKA